MPTATTHIGEFEALFGVPAKAIFDFLKPFVELGMLLQFILMLASDHGIKALTRNVAVMLVSLYFMTHFKEGLSTFQDAITNGIIVTLKADPGSVQTQYAQALAEASKNAPSASIFSIEGVRNALISAALFVIGLLLQGLQIVLVYIQRLLSVGAYALSPIWFALFALDSQRGNATKFGLHIFALSIWPVSWAVGSIGTSFFLKNMASIKGEIASAAALGMAGWVDLPILCVIGLYSVVVAVIGPILLHILIPSGGHYALRAVESAVAKISSSISTRK